MCDVSIMWSTLIASCTSIVEGHSEVDTTDTQLYVLQREVILCCVCVLISKSVTAGNRRDQLSVADQIFECIPEEKDKYSKCALYDCLCD